MTSPPAAKRSRFLDARVFRQRQQLFPGISYEAFACDGDLEALKALKSLAGADRLLIWLEDNLQEQVVQNEHNETMVRVDDRNYRSLYLLHRRCSEILCCGVPELYINKSPELLAYTTGHTRTCITLSRGLIENLTADQLSFVLGHELGHIKAGHGIYHFLGNLLVSRWELVANLVPLPGLGLLRIPLMISYWEWLRRSEVTCDRVGLLCVQDLRSSVEALAKMAGFVAGSEDEMNIEAIAEQGENFEEMNHVAQFFAAYHNIQNTHPIIPTRLRLLREYASTDAVKKIMRGDYPRDEMGHHEGGRRLKCGCGETYNAKLKQCPKCGRLATPPALPRQEPQKPFSVDGAIDNLRTATNDFFTR